ncbi:LAME_0F10616g1_1 [Lachancea meyersii CBS 8951]|uniref:LAME_0F10616g1_1 n=1 Tax=Lachancea meyersii CBS 8951 TaxID=1266667 RepID=A0A1G4JVL9_9SACH|nr:LAME_0F10616g1_1 [Lachancea meyersii CBS 8951]
MGNSVAEPLSCVRCKEPLVMGHAYELGGDRWHTHCFSCYKCDKPLSCDSNFLVLGTGALICYACSDSCKSCGKKIDDLAIILASSNEAYCSDCFKCCKCDAKIEDLRYAKTKRGLFCIACHERLLEKRKNYEERKRRHKKQLPLIPPGGSMLDLNAEDVPQTEPQTEPDIVIPARSNQRPMSPIKDLGLRTPAFLKEDTSVNSSPNDHRHLISSVSSLAVPLDFSAATSPAGEVPIIGEKHNASDFALNKSIIRSNSESVMAQFLIDGDYVSTAEEESVKREQGEMLDASKSSEEGTVMVNTPKKTHRSQLSIDDMLQHTLESDGYTENKNENEEQHLLGLPKEQKKILLNRTPLRNSKEENVNKSPTAYRQGLILDDEDVMNALNSPARVKAQEMSPRSGLGIVNSLDFAAGSAEDEVIGLSYEKMVPKERSSESATSQGSRSPSMHSHQRRTSGGNAKKLGRSLSLRSKSIMMNLRPKSKDSDSNGTAQKGGDQDTHSGWGVTTQTFPEAPSPKGRIVSKHPSDSTVYPSAGRSSLDSGLHKRSTSGANGAVSVFRTPPLDTQASFSKSVSSHNKNPSMGTVQIEEADEESESTPTNDQFLKKDLWHMELALRRLKLEINQLESTRNQLMHDVDSLKSTKSALQDEMHSLRVEKDMNSSALEPVDSYERENFEESSDRQDATASVATTAKPKFWKLFSGNRPNASYSNGSNKLDISPPVLQNPNEFNDVKFLPVQNKSRTSSSSPPAAKDGRTLYGSTLVARCTYEKNEMPMIVTTCIKHIESSEDYLKSDGLYRKSGSQVLIEQIETDFAQSNPNELISETLRAELRQDIHAVSGVLKRYLRKLPNPIFTFQVYEPLMALVRDSNLVNELPLKAANNDEYQGVFQATIKQLTKILCQMPPQHYTLLKVLVEHLEKVARHSDDNLMNLHNLSLVFTPGLIRDFSGEKDISDMRERNYLVAFVLANHRSLFE